MLLLFNSDTNYVFFIVENSCEVSEPAHSFFGYQKQIQCGSKFWATIPTASALKKQGYQLALSARSQWTPNCSQTHHKSIVRTQSAHLISRADVTSIKHNELYCVLNVM